MSFTSHPEVVVIVPAAAVLPVAAVAVLRLVAEPGEEELLVAAVRRVLPLLKMGTSLHFK